MQESRRLDDSQADDFHGDLAWIADRLDALVVELKRLNDRPLILPDDQTMLIFDQEAQAYRMITSEEQKAIRKLTIQREMETSTVEPEKEPVTPKRIALTNEQIVSLIKDKRTREVGFRAAQTVEPSEAVLKAIQDVRDDQASLDARNLLDRYPHRANIPYLIDRLIHEHDDRCLVSIQRAIYTLGLEAAAPLKQAAEKHFDNALIGKTFVALIVVLMDGESPSPALINAATSSPNKYARIAAIEALLDRGNSSIIELVFDEHGDDYEVRAAVAERLSQIPLPVYPFSPFSNYD